MSSLTQKLIPFNEVEGWREILYRQRSKLIVTNGCFDLLHIGHVHLLEKARGFGDFLLVGINSDAAVNALKGPGRPVNRCQDRMRIVAALQAVDAVCEVDDIRVTELLKAAKPDIWVKGGDYTIQTLDEDERNAVMAYGGDIVLVDPVIGASTTRLVNLFSRC